MKKGSKGGYADYSTSSWARRERPLSDAEQAAIKTHGLFNLSDFLPKKPTDVEMKVIKEMFEASVDGEAYDAERWGQYYRAAGMNQATGDPNTRNTPSAKAAIVEDEDIPFEPTQAKAATVAKPASSDNKASDILSMIRARQSK